MKNILNKLKINYLTYFFFLLALLAGYFKNLSVIYTIVIIHELGHIFFIKIFKYKLIKIEIFPFGGFTTIHKSLNSSITKEIIIAFGGIFFQLLSLVIFSCFVKVKTSYISRLFINYNLILLIFNLLPINPLDGYIILKTNLEKFFSYQKAFYFSQLVSFISLIFFLLLNFYYHLNNYVIIGFLIYKLIMSFKNWRYIYNLFILERYLYDLPYKKIEYDKGLNLNKLKRETYHYFKEKNTIISEKQLLNTKFRLN